MKFASLQTDQGVRPVGVDTRHDPPRYVDLCAADTKLPTSWLKILAREDGLVPAAHAFVTGSRKQLLVSGEVTDMWSPLTSRDLPSASKNEIVTGIAVVLREGPPNLSSQKAFDYVAGFTPFLCLSGNCQIGPWLTTADEILDSQELTCEVFRDERSIRTSCCRESLPEIGTRVADRTTDAPLKAGDLVILPSSVLREKIDSATGIRINYGALGNLDFQS